MALKMSLPRDSIPLKSLKLKGVRLKFPETASSPQILNFPQMSLKITRPNFCQFLHLPTVLAYARAVAQRHLKLPRLGGNLRLATWQYGRTALRAGLRTHLEQQSSACQLTHAYAPAAFAYAYPSHDTT